MKAIIITLLLVNFLIPGKAVAQGCSDAGFCTIGHLDQLQQGGEGKKHQKFSLLLPVGVGDEKVFVFAPALQYDNQLTKKWALQAKLTANVANGNLGSVAGPGDLFLSGIYTFPKKQSWQFSLTAGIKLPLDKSNLKENGQPLPMQYQSSLGTVDLITGITATNNRWQFAAGWQQPLSGSNSNHFLPAYRTDNAAKQYTPSNEFNRKGDVLARVAYQYKVNKKFSLNGGLLGICHLGKDTYRDDNISKDPIIITGSGGLTLNLTALASYQVNRKITVSLSGGVPLVVRDVRPDGLTREFVLSPEVSFSF